MSTNDKLLDSMISLAVADQAAANGVVQEITKIMASVDSKVLDNPSVTALRKEGVWTKLLDELRQTQNFNDFATQRGDLLLKLMRNSVDGVSFTTSQLKGTGYKVTARIAGKEVGFFTFGIMNDDAPAGFLQSGYIEVLKGYRSRGIATNLYEYAAAHAKQLGNEGIYSPKGARLDQTYNGPEEIVSELSKTQIAIRATDTFYGLKALSDSYIRSVLKTHPFKMGEDSAMTLDEVFKQLVAGKQTDVERALKLAVLEGKAENDILQMLRGTRAMGFKDGILNYSKRPVEALTRTMLNSINNQVASEFYQANSSILSGLRWVSTLDSRTTPICQARDGMVFPVNSGPRPPAHIRCRSFMAPLTKSWKELGLPFDEQQGSRASMDGEVPGDMTYSQWLKTKSPDFIEKVLGPSRAALFTSGKADVTDFVNDKGHILNLDQLKNILT